MHKFVLGYFSKVLLLLSLLLFLSACQMQMQTSAVNATISNQDSNSKNSSISKPEATPVPKDENMPAPISIKKVTVLPGKPGSTMYSFEIEFNTRRDGYKWLLVRNFLDKPLNENINVDADETTGLPVTGYRHPVTQNQGQVVVLNFYGENPFRAIRPPDEGTIQFSRMTMISFSDIAAFEVWEVGELLVNGKTPLDEWLPYDTISTATQRPLDDQSIEGKRLGLDTNTPGKNYPKEKIKTIVAQGIRKWNIPFKINTGK